MEELEVSGRCGCAGRQEVDAIFARRSTFGSTRALASFDAQKQLLVLAEVGGKDDGRVDAQDSNVREEKHSTSIFATS